MDSIRIVPGTAYPGEGISRGLARGLLVYHGDRNITGEGMGIGSIAARDREFTYFSRSSADAVEDGILRRTFSLDTRMLWSIGKKPSLTLTRLIEAAIGTYMAHPRLQRILMLPVLPLRTLLGIHPVFETVPSRGTATFTYRISGTLVEIHAAIRVPPGMQERVCLLNELSAAVFSDRGEDRESSGQPPGWEPVSPLRLPVSLVDPAGKIRFFLEEPAVSPPCPFTIFRGREWSADLCWAGFCIELAPREDGSPVDVRYRVGVTGGSA
jgi:hypothetical protein